MELYLDWPSNLSRDPAADNGPSKDRIDISLLNTLGFDCEDDMPSFQNDASRVSLPHHGNTVLTVDWYSAKHNVLAIETCFDITHRVMKPVLQWASGSPVDQAERTKFINRNFDIFNTRMSNQVLRLNAFMSLAMYDIDKIRVKYRPNGYLCSVPILRSALGNRCMPVRTGGP
jgi:hypothetical protein